MEVFLISNNYFFKYTFTTSPLLFKFLILKSYPYLNKNEAKSIYGNNVEIMNRFISDCDADSSSWDSTCFDSSIGVNIDLDGYVFVETFSNTSAIVSCEYGSGDTYCNWRS